MGCDMVVALGRATVDGHTLFGHNSGQPPRQGAALRLFAGLAHVPGETVPLPHLALPQVRQTFTVLGSQPGGLWGFQHGVNEHGVAAARAPLHTRLGGPADGGLLGPDLVRLVLERSHSAQQALDLLTDLVRRLGQAPLPGGAEGGAGDNVFLLADGAEAFVVETSGHHWVCQQVREVRAAAAVPTIREDWDRIAPGFADHAIRAGWWPGDGSKLDFAGVVDPHLATAGPALRRWGRATLLLAEQAGHVDVAFLRRVLSDHFEGTAHELDPAEPVVGPPPLCQHPSPGALAVTAASLVVPLRVAPERLLTAWCAFGPPCLGVFFPVFLEGELPAAFAPGPAAAAAPPAGLPAPHGADAPPPAGGVWERMLELAAALGKNRTAWDKARDSLGRLQARFDQEAEEFAAEGACLKNEGKCEELQRQTKFFLEHCLERFAEVWAGLMQTLGRNPRRLPVPAPSSPRQPASWGAFDWE